MNDFLLSLVDRAAGRMPTLERRPRALFESTATRTSREAAAGGGFDELSDDAALFEDRAVTAPPAAATAMPHEPHQRTIHIEPPRDTNVNRHKPDSAEQAARAITPAVTRPAVVAAETVALQKSRVETPKATLPPAPPRSMNSPIALPGPTPNAAVAIATTPAPRPAPRTETKMLSEQPGRTRSRPHEDRAFPGPERTPRMVASPPHPSTASKAEKFAMKRDTPPAVLLARAQSAAKTPAASFAPPAPAPVHISIGRVEVRASTANTERKSRAAKSATPQLKLEDYLRERSRSAR